MHQVRLPGGGRKGWERTEKRRQLQGQVQGHLWRAQLKTPAPCGWPGADLPQRGPTWVRPCEMRRWARPVR